MKIEVEITPEVSASLEKYIRTQLPAGSQSEITVKDVAAFAVRKFAADVEHAAHGGQVDAGRRAEVEWLTNAGALAGDPEKSP